MADMMSVEDIVSSIRKGDRRIASQLMSMVENATREGEECLRRLRNATGRSHIIGVTGWPGVGKSTLISSWGRRFLSCISDQVSVTAGLLVFGSLRQESFVVKGNSIQWVLRQVRLKRYFGSRARTILREESTAILNMLTDSGFTR
jgi:ATPase subunit of ABC transporter with duplicated ATPase domains